jgi:hypothetical protein
MGPLLESMHTLVAVMATVRASNPAPDPQRGAIVDDYLRRLNNAFLEVMAHPDLLALAKARWHTPGGAGKA